MPDTPVPPEAVTAASAVLWGVHGTTPPYLPRVAEYVSVESTGAEREGEMAAFRAAGAESDALNDDLVRRALEAAAPLIAAAERERIENELGNGQDAADALRVIAILVRRLGGSVAITDADQLAAVGVLLRIPEPDGYSLAVRDAAAGERVPALEAWGEDGT